MENKKLSIRMIFPLMMSFTIAFCMICCMLFSIRWLSKYFVREDFSVAHSFVFDRRTGKMLEEVNLYWIDNKLAQTKQEEKYVIDIDTRKIYKYK